MFNDISKKKKKDYINVILLLSARRSHLLELKNGANRPTECIKGRTRRLPVAGVDIKGASCTDFPGEKGR